MQTKDGNEKEPSTTLGALLALGDAVYNPMFVTLARAAQSTTALDKHAHNLGWPAPFPRNLRLAAQAFLKKPQEVEALISEREVRPAEASFSFVQAPAPFYGIQVSQDFKLGGITDGRDHWPILMRELGWVTSVASEMGSLLTSFDYGGDRDVYVGIESFQEESLWNTGSPGEWDFGISSAFEGGELRISGQFGRVKTLIQLGSYIFVSGMNVMIPTTADFPAFYKILSIRQEHRNEGCYESIRIGLRHDIGPKCGYINLNGSAFGFMEYERVIWLTNGDSFSVVLTYGIEKHNLVPYLISRKTQPFEVRAGEHHQGFDETKMVAATKQATALSNACFRKNQVSLEQIAGISMVRNPPKFLSDLLT